MDRREDGLGKVREMTEEQDHLVALAQVLESFRGDVGPAAFGRSENGGL
jgi:hypothetical protein